jgi:hypothetical protein
VPEWSNGAAWKAVPRQGPVGSNPTPSAIGVKISNTMNIESIINEIDNNEAFDALGYSTYEDFWAYPTDDALNMAYLADKYGYDIATKLMMIAILSSSLIVNTTSHVVAQSIQTEEPIVEIDISENVSSSEANKEEDLYINDLESFKNRLQKGMSTKNYRLSFINETVYGEVLDYISQNNMFFSTGSEIAPLNIELLSSLWGNQFNFMVINDSQPAQVINESYTTSFPITQGNLIPSSLISATESVNLEGGLIKTSTTITNPNGIITKTLSYLAPWTYEASRTVTGEAIASGRYGFLTTPTLKFGDKSFNINIIYTGGSFKNGDFLPSFEYEPIYQTANGSFRFHGNAIGQNILDSTSPVEKLFIIGADSSGYYIYNEFENMFMHRFVRLLDQANKIEGRNYEVVFTESIGGSIDRHNAYGDYWTGKGIEYEKFVTTFAAAGNNSQLVAWDTKNPENFTQVVATTPDFNALTYYSNYGIDTSLYLGGKGDFLAKIPYLSADGLFDFIQRRMDGTSMATPLDASYYAIHSFLNENRLPISEVFTTTNDLIFMGELSGGQLITNVLTMSDSSLNNLLSQFPENGLIPVNGSLRFDADWASFNGRFYKKPYLSALGLSWDEFINMPDVFQSAKRELTFSNYIFSPGLPKIYLLNDLNKIERNIPSFTYPSILTYIYYVDQNSNLPKTEASIFSVKQIKQNLRVGPRDWFAQDDLNAKSFDYNATLIRTNFDPSFGSQTEKHVVYIPLANAQ